jgi:NADH-quinone oxidoreductase subunit J
MMLNRGSATLEQERRWLRPKMWLGPFLLAGVLLAELIYMLARIPPSAGGKVVGTKLLGLTLFGPYLLGVELASMLLLTGLVGAHHLGLRPPTQSHRKGE